MPWLWALLRGTSVLARCDESGALARSERGLVEIRYRPGGKRYDARAENLEVEPGQPLLSDEEGETLAREPATEASSETAARAARPKRAVKLAPSGPPVLAYTDGACSGNPGPAGVGVVIVDGDRRVELSEFLGDRSTNNVAELTAVLRALREVADRARPIALHTDSQYAIGVLTKGWKAKANAELIAEIRDELAARPHVRVKYVPGHAGVILNERADELAREAVSTRASRRREWSNREGA